MNHLPVEAGAGRNLCSRGMPCSRGVLSLDSSILRTCGFLLCHSTYEDAAATHSEDK